MALYPNSTTRDLNLKLGEHPSVLDYGAVPDGVTDNTAAFQAAINSIVAFGGGTLRIPASLTGQPYLLNASVLITSAVPLVLEGEGVASIIKRGAIITAGQGVFDLTNASYVTFRDLCFDGGTSGAPTGLNYSSIPSGDPMSTILTQNSMFWIHGGAFLTWERVVIQHTSGYAILLDARTVNISNVTVDHCRFANNRQYTFGTNNADLNYGSWTGGIFYKNDGVTNTTGVINLFVRNSRFERNTGNCVWGHGYGFAAQHQNIKIDSNQFVDCGLDGILHGNTVGGSANDNSFRRIGYICVDDTSASTPKFLNNAFATALDTTGIFKDGTYSDNSFLDVNGDCINGDGFCHGVIANNTMRIAVSGTPEYVEDNVASMGPGGTGCVTQGIIMNNSGNQAEADTYVLITGNRMHNLPGINIGMFATRLSTCIGNFLYCPNSVSDAPIVLGNVGTSANLRAYGNVVTRNVVYYSPATSQGCIVEDAAGGAFSSGDSNWVALNVVVSSTGNAYEFQRNANTASVTAVVYCSNATGLTQPATHYFQREGSGTGSALKIYYVENTSQYQHAQFQAYSLGTGTRSPLFNVSEAGVGGAFTTGNRTALPFVDVMATGKLYADAFLELTDATYADADANLINGVVGGGSTGTATVALLRYKGSVGSIQISTQISSGTRVWGSLGGGFWTESAGLLYPTNTTDKVLIHSTTDDASGAFLQVNGIISTSAGNGMLIGTNTNSGSGFLVQVVGGIEIRNAGNSLYFSSTGQRILGAMSGTFADRLSFQNSLANSNTIPGVIPSGTANTSGWNFFNASDTANAGNMQLSLGNLFANLSTSSLGTGTALPIYIRPNGVQTVALLTSGSTLLGGNTADNGSGATVQVHGNIWLDINVSGAHGQVFGFGASGDSTIIDDQGFEGNFFRIKAKGSLSSGDYFDWTMWGTGTVPLGNHIIQMRNSSNQYVLNFNELGGAATGTPGASTGLWTFVGSVSLSNAGGGNQNILQALSTASTTGNQTYINIGAALSSSRVANLGFIDNTDATNGALFLGLYGDNPATGAGLIIKRGSYVGIGVIPTVGGAFLQLAGVYPTTTSINAGGQIVAPLFNSSATGTNLAFQVNGGAGGQWQANGLLGIGNLNIFTGGTIQWNGTSYLRYNSGLQWFDGTTWQNFSTGGGGAVSSVTGSGAGISVSPTTGAVVVSNTGVTSVAGTTNQVNVSASTGAVTISLPSSVAISGTFQSTNTGAGICFQANGGTWSVNGNGAVSGAGPWDSTNGYKVGGTSVIDSTRAIANVTTINASGLIQSSATGASLAIQVNGGTLQINGAGALSLAGPIDNAGAYKVNGNLGTGVTSGSASETVTTSAGTRPIRGGIITQT